MPDIKLRDGAGVEQVYTGVDTITVPLADGSGTWTFGFGEKDLVFGGETIINYLPEELIHRYGKYFQFNVEAVRGIFNNFPEQKNAFAEGMEFIFRPTSSNIFGFSNFFQGLRTKELPKIKISGIAGSTTSSYGTCQLSSMFQDAFYLTSIPDDIFDNVMVQDTVEGQVSLYETKRMGSCAQMFSQCYSLRHLPSWVSKLSNSMATNSYSQTMMYYFVNNCYVLNEATGIMPPEYISGAYTSNLFNSTLSNTYSLKHFTFATNNGVPYVRQYKSQTLDLSQVAGATSDYSEYGATNVLDSKGSDVSLDKSRERYQQIKNTDSWLAYNSNNIRITWNGISNVPIKSLFTPYGHDAAVETINSLPDTSAYLASAGGTNTIKFKKYCGGEIDGGGVNDLTAEEIAVAADKGWTVTLVD